MNVSLPQSALYIRPSGDHRAFYCPSSHPPLDRRLHALSSTLLETSVGLRNPATLLERALTWPWSRYTGREQDSVSQPRLHIVEIRSPQSTYVYFGYAPPEQRGRAVWQTDTFAVD